jgi:hypothetical protein
MPRFHGPCRSSKLALTFFGNSLVSVMDYDLFRVTCSTHKVYKSEASVAFSLYPIHLSNISAEKHSVKIHT